jgi:hypothetical protein
MPRRGTEADPQTRSGLTGANIRDRACRALAAWWSSTAVTASSLTAAPDRPELRALASQQGEQQTAACHHAHCPQGPAQHAGYAGYLRRARHAGRAPARTSPQTAPGGACTPARGSYIARACRAQGKWSRTQTRQHECALQVCQSTSDCWYAVTATHTGGMFCDRWCLDERSSGEVELEQKCRPRD